MLICSIIFTSLSGACFWAGYTSKFQDISTGISQMIGVSGMIVGAMMITLYAYIIWKTR